MRNLLVGLANATAAVVFVAIGPVRWSAVIPLAVGCLLGGRLGPISCAGSRRRRFGP